MRRVLVAAGLVLVVAALLWRPVAVPLLVRFPTDLDQATRYEGTFTLYVDQETGVSLAEPVRLPLEIERRIRTVPGESGADTVVVQELVTFGVSGIDQHETHQYVMDRRSMQNQDDPRSWSYSPGNVVDRAGTYRVNLALGTDGDHSYAVWENEPGAGFSMAAEPGGRPTARHGLTLLAMEEIFGDVPVTAVYRQELRRQGFPLALTFDALAARLAGDGVDVDAGLAGLDHADQATATAARGARLPLRFFRYNDGHALVEPRTGAIVDLLVSDEGISATVDLTPLGDLRAALDRADAPAAASLAAGLDALDEAPPTRVYHLHYGQTPDSVTEIAALTRDELVKLDWAERHVPRLLGALGFVLLAAGALAVARHHRRRPDAPLPDPPSKPGRGRAEKVLAGT
jgi:hypothetical protein